MSGRSGEGIPVDAKDDAKFGRLDANESCSPAPSPPRGTLRGGRGVGFTTNELGVKGAGVDGDGTEEVSVVAEDGVGNDGCLNPVGVWNPVSAYEGAALAGVPIGIPFTGADIEATLNAVEAGKSALFSMMSFLTPDPGWSISGVDRNPQLGVEGSAESTTCTCSAGLDGIATAEA